MINQAMELICDQGKICCYGIAPECHYDIDWEKAPYNWQLQFQQFPSKVEEGEANAQILSWIRSGIIDLKDYISDYFSFDDIQVSDRLQFWRFGAFFLTVLWKNDTIIRDIVLYPDGQYHILG